jgi:predicted esterase
MNMSIRRQTLRSVASLVALASAIVGCGSSPLEPESHDRVWVEGGRESFTFPSDGLEMAGMLYLPSRFSDARVPAVVFAHGSGPGERGEPLPGQLGMTFGRTVQVFTDLANSLMESGYAVLLYDKRTCGTFNGCSDNSYPRPPTQLSVDVHVQDVEAAIDALAERPEVDPDNVIPAGHSQGAIYVPSILSEMPSVPAGILLAGPYSPVDTLIAMQAARLRELMIEAGLTEEQIDRELGSIDLLVEQLAALRAGEFSGNSIDGDSVVFWQSLMDLSDLTPSVAASIDRPLLAVGGSYDWNVPPEELMSWRSLLEGVEPNPGHDTVSLPCVTHALNCIAEPDYRRITVDDIGCVVDPSVIDAVTAFLDRVTGRDTP